MSAETFALVSSWSYGLAVAAYAAFAVRVVIGWTRSAVAVRLVVALVAMMLWGIACGIVSNVPTTGSLLLVNVTDALRYGAWLAFVDRLMRGPSGDANVDSGWPRVVAFVLLGGAVVFSDALPFSRLLGASARLDFSIQLGLAVFGLAATEHLYRRAPAQARWALKPLCVALAAMFGFELFFYADAMLFGRIDPDIWMSRGIAMAMLVPFLGVATARNAGWSIDLHLSRGAVMHSTAVVVSGLFLILLAVSGYLVRFVGGDLGRMLAIEVVFAGLIFGVLVAASGRYRARLRVFVSKHFFSYRYDYRSEWLRITRTLADETRAAQVGERVIIALADLVESPAGALWLKDDQGRFSPAGRWNMPAFDAVEEAGGSLSAFLARNGWIVNLVEAAREPAGYEGLSLPPWLAARPGLWLVVPLIAGQELIGFVALSTPRTPIDVDWEVRDLLKTASRQAASYLGQIRATEALLEARKFDAFNRMSAFVVHDLKNLVAQLSLMLRNAERHRDNPEFQRDMLTTVEHVVGRMNALMLQLRTGTTPVEKRRLVDLDGTVRRVCAAKQGHRASISVDSAPLYALGHEDRLEHVIGHLVQNALDATAASGEVSVRVTRGGSQAIVEVVDTGPGMTPEFVRERLFKPFETTKASGMGIGVYESAQYVRSIGGEIDVDSAPGRGTTVRVRLVAGDDSVESPVANRVASTAGAP